MMRNSTIYLTVALAGCLVLAGGAFLRGSPTGTVITDDAKAEKRTISTSGTATIYVKPDAVRLFFGVQTIATDIASARQENAVRVKKVRQALQALTITDLKTKTTDVNVALVQSHRSQEQLPKILGFRITHSFTVLLTDSDTDRLAENASRVMDSALAAGVNVLSGVAFFKQDDAEFKREALTKAVEDAAKNARALAQGGNVQIVDTISINGQPQFHYAQPMMQRQMANVMYAEGSDTSIVLGEQEITCNVSVTCTY